MICIDVPTHIQQSTDKPLFAILPVIITATFANKSTKPMVVIKQFVLDAVSIRTKHNDAVVIDAVSIRTEAKDTFEIGS